MRYRLGVEPHRPNGGDRAGIVDGIDGVGQQKLGLPLRCVDLNRENDSRSNQHPAVARLGNDEGAFLNSRLIDRFSAHG